MTRSKEADAARQRAAQMVASGVGDIASAGVGFGQAGSFGPQVQQFLTPEG